MAVAAQAAEDAAPLPPSADLSQNSPPVAYQGPVASCVAWVTAYYMRGYYAKRDGYYPGGGPGGSGSFAPMYVFSQVAKGQNAGITFNAALDLEVAQGIDTRADYNQGDTDYTDQPTAAEQANAAAYKLAGYTVLFQGANQGDAARQAIEASIAAGDPVGLGLPVYDNFWNADATHDYVDVINMGANHGNHAVMAAKYDANGVWVENQWGTGWGLNGWVELSWAFVDQYVWQAVTMHPAAVTHAPTAPPATPSATNTATPVPSNTATDTAQPTPTSTNTAMPVQNATNTATPIAPTTATPVPFTATPLATDTATPHAPIAPRHVTTSEQHTRRAPTIVRRVRPSYEQTRAMRERALRAGAHSAALHHAAPRLGAWKASGGRLVRLADPLHGPVVRLGGRGSRHDDTAYRDVTLPRQARHLTLRFTYRALSLAANANGANGSRLMVTVVSQRDDHLLAHVLRAVPPVRTGHRGLMTLPPLWHTVSYDLTRFRGHRVRLLFHVHLGRGANAVFDLAAVRITLR